MSADLSFVPFAASIVGLGGGLWLLVRGMAGYREATLIGDVATSPISSLAVGEVRVSGVIEPAELALVSPLQSRTCVYYRSRVSEAEGRGRRTILDEERAVGFRVRDRSGDVRIFPRGATWDVPDRFGASDDEFGGSPIGLSPRRGPAIRPATPDREAIVADLLTVRPGPGGLPDVIDGGGPLGLLGGFALGGLALGGGGRDYHEGWLEPGETITVVGTALPFDQLPDPDSADLGEEAIAAGGPLAEAADPEVAADLAVARAAGTLETDPAEAWGNAAIPGFGIGRPVRPPELDPAAHALPLADADAARRISRTFDIAPDALIFAGSPDRPLVISLGPPAVAVARGRDRFLVGLVGAVIAIGSAIWLALLIGGGLR